MREIARVAQLDEIKRAYLEKQNSYDRRILVCGGAGCISSHCREVLDALKHALKENGLSDSVQVIVTGCMGICAVGPVLLVEPDGIFYISMKPEKVADMVLAHLVEGNIVKEYTFYDNYRKCHVPRLEVISFFKEQVRIALRNCGQMEYSSLEAYIARDGYGANQSRYLHDSGRGCRGNKEIGPPGPGGSFPTGLKWEAGMKAPGGQKYMVCNADEGDPGAFMDRSILEGDPTLLLKA